MLKIAHTFAPLLLAAASLSAANTPIITFMQDGGWCWYQDPRAIIENDQLVIAGLSGQSGDVKISAYDLVAHEDKGTVVIHKNFQRDDHDVPALYARPDGSILAAYARHNSQKIHHFRISEPDDYLKWSSQTLFKHDYDAKVGVSYMNLHYMADEGLLYNFFRDGQTYNPSFITSSDHGKIWGNRTQLILDEVEGRHRPYARYTQRDANTVAITFTEGHPRAYGNSIYYADFRDGGFYRADGTKIKDLANGPLRPTEAELVYQGSATKHKPKGFESVPGSAWTSSVAVDSNAYPHLGYTLYLSNTDHRYRLASWNGEKWIDREVAYGGNCLYERESSYTGLITLDPEDPTQVYISTDVDPTTGQALGDHHEIYHATVSAQDDINTIQWTPITSGSDADNIRPIVVSKDGHKAVIWLHGTYNTYTNYNLDVQGTLIKGGK